ncbi:MAG: type III-B CRISPR module RAMP protein Cmr4 [Myxococcota bacterium]
MSTTRMLLLHAVTPLHVGTGRGEGVIDLPIARDQVTRHPLLPGSGLKGPMRAAASEGDRIEVFGPEHNNITHASAVRFSDARLVAMPCPSDHGTFAWVTSPMILARWRRDFAHLIDFPSTPPEITSEQCACAPDAAIIGDGNVVLDGERYEALALDSWPQWFAELIFPGDLVWQNMMANRLAILHDDAFDALARHGTDVRAHIRIDPTTGTVHDGALWYEEAVPAEAIFAGVVQFIGSRRAGPAEALKVIEGLLEGPLTLGGSKTSGMGIVRGRLAGGGA